MALIVALGLVCYANSLPNGFVWDDHAQIEQNRSTAFTQALPAVRAASVFRLSKAMPTELETPNVILQINQLAVYSGISFDQITPNASSSTTAVTSTSPDPFAAQPIQVKFTGSFYNLRAVASREALRLSFL